MKIRKSDVRESEFEIKRIMHMHPRLIVIITEHAFPDSLQILLLLIVLNRKRSNVQFLKIQAFQNNTFATLK